MQQQWNWTVILIILSISYLKNRITLVSFQDDGSSFMLIISFFPVSIFVINRSIVAFRILFVIKLFNCPLSYPGLLLLLIMTFKLFLYSSSYFIRISEIFSRLFSPSSNSVLILTFDRWSPTWTQFNTITSMVMFALLVVLPLVFSHVHCRFFLAKRRFMALRIYEFVLSRGTFTLLKLLTACWQLPWMKIMSYGLELRTLKLENLGNFVDLWYFCGSEQHVIFMSIGLKDFIYSTNNHPSF